MSQTIFKDIVLKVLSEKQEHQESLQEAMLPTATHYKSLSVSIYLCCAFKGHLLLIDFFAQ